MRVREIALMKVLIGAIAAAAVMSVAMSPAKAASFSCMELDGRPAAEIRICNSQWLGALDERMDSWYRRALERARYFDQTATVRDRQRSWIAERNSCGSSFFCIRRSYVERIRALKDYVEHV
jgi:uncharacterized protein